MFKKWSISITAFVVACILSCSNHSVNGTPELPVKAEDILISKNVLYLTVGQESEITARLQPDIADTSGFSSGIYNPFVASFENGKIIARSTGTTKVFFSCNEIKKEADIIVRNLDKNRLIIHFRTEENTAESYSKYGMVLMGQALPKYDIEGYAYTIGDTLYDFRNFLQFQQKDSFGMYTEIRVLDDRDLKAGILNNSRPFDYFSDMPFIHKVNLLSSNELWFLEGVNQVFVSEPRKDLTGLKISGENRILKAGEKITLQLLPVPSSVTLSNISWQTSDQFIADVDSTGTVTGIKTGTTIITASTGGLKTSKTVCVEPGIKESFVRIHYKRYNSDYDNWFIETENKTFPFKHYDLYGGYIDIPAQTGLAFSLKTEFEVAQNFSGSSTNNTELWILEGKNGVFTERPVMDVGALKIANSWSDKNYQNGRNWENVVDGFFYMSYDALKKNNAYVYYLGAKEIYQPRIVAVFNIEGNFRGDFRISFGVGDSIAPRKTKSFLNYPFTTYGKEYASKFPATDIAFDISEFMPLQNENVYMEIRDGAFNRTLKVNSFAIEIYDDYSSEPVQIIADSGLPAFSLDGGVRRFIIEGLTVTEKSALAKKSSSTSFEISSRPLSASDLAEYTPCPARMPADRFLNLVNNGNIKLIDKVLLNSKSLSKSQDVTRIDNSKSPHFPPVGSQEFKGSCTAWAFGYYMATYNIARRNNWDLSGARWLNGNISDGYRDKVMSPDFLYNLINEGIDYGSYGYMAALVLEDIGIASLNTAPVVYDSVDAWPTEQAFREAILNRHDESSFFYCSIKTDEDIENIKNLLREGELLAIAFQASGIYLSENDTYTQQYAGTTLDHMVTVVGFDDKWTTDSRE